jgi:ribonuclease VapC
VLDASALLALLLAEPGGETVRAVLADAAMSAVNFREVIGHYVRNGVTEAQVRQVLDPLPLDFVPFDMELAYAAGLLLPATRSAGLSLGDPACLSLARRLGCRAMTRTGHGPASRRRPESRSNSSGLEPTHGRAMRDRRPACLPIHQSLIPSIADFPTGTTVL